MPTTLGCTADGACPATGIETNSFSQPNFVPDSVEHFANMGWVGFAKLVIPSLTANNILRVNSADINLSQDVEMPDVIDGRIDRTIYKLGPKIVEGTLSLPLVADTDAATLASLQGCVTSNDLNIAGTLLDNIWCWATSRGPQGRLTYTDARLDVRYANHAAFSFDRSVVNTLGLSVTQGDQIGLDINVIGRSRSPAILDIDTVTQEPKIVDFLAPARVLTWNDISVNALNNCGNGEDLFFSNQVREFSMDINNNADRFYSLNGSLFPVDINVGQREISGSLTLMGLADRLRVLADTNAERFTEKNEIRVAIYIGNDTFNGGSFDPRNWTGADSTQPASGDPIWFKKLTGVVFQIEEMSMTNDVFETSVNWHALANDQFNFNAFNPDSSRCLFPSWQ